MLPLESIATLRNLEAVGRVIRGLKLTAERQVQADIIDRIDSLKADLGGRPTDDFGFNPESIKPLAPVMAWLYHEFFRVQTHGLTDMPTGRVLFVSNHSGQIPLDAMMVGTALLFEGQPPRAVRSMVERWVPSLPFVSTLFARVGQVLGTPENCRTLLQQDEAVLVFPEGVRGISKTYDHAYQLQEFGNGFMRLALENNTPIVPVAVVGAEEQYPALWNLERLARLLAVPALPITPLFPLAGLLGLLPLPVRYRIHFGRPLYFTGDPHEEESSLLEKVNSVKSTIQEMLDRGVAEREHIFW